MRNASLSKSEELLVPARVQGNINFPVAANQMRRFLGPFGGADRQDILVAADAGVCPRGEGAIMRPGYRAARRKRNREIRGRRRAMQSKAKIKLRD